LDIPINEVSAIAGPAGLSAVSQADAPLSDRSIEVRFSASPHLSQNSGELRLSETTADLSTRLASSLDRLRADFQRLHQRIEHPDRQHAASMHDLMDRALRTQMDVFTTAIGFHAGLSATQQSQHGVRTLVEKA
jgi:hypothetical protein